MANYLMPAGNLSPLPASPQRSRSDIMFVDNMYKLKIYNKAGTIAFNGFIPPDFSISLASSWNSPFTNTSMLDLAGIAGDKAKTVASTASAGLKLGGGSSMVKAASAKVWAGPSYLTMDLPIFIDAYVDTKAEVVENIVRLLSLAAPSEGPGGLLIPPGPIPLATAANDFLGTDAFEDKEAFVVDIGNFFSMNPCVVDNVVASFDNVMEDVTGNPVACDFVLQVSSYLAVTREDLRKWFKMTQPSTGGA